MNCKSNNVRFNFLDLLVNSRKRLLQRINLLRLTSIFMRRSLISLLFICFFLNTGCLEHKQTVQFNSQNNPAGTVKLTDGNTTINSRMLNLDLETNRANQIAVFVDKACRALGAHWEPYAPQQAIELPDLDGPHTISIIFRDDQNFASDCQTLNVILDREGPSFAASVLSDNHVLPFETPNFKVTELKDSFSKVKRLEGRIVQIDSQVPMTNWTPIEQPNNAVKIGGLSLTDGQIYKVELRAFDELENVSSTQSLSPFQVGPSVLLTSQGFPEAGFHDYTIKLSAPSIDTFDVNYRTQENTALVGVDFESAQGIAHFNSGSDTVNISIKTIENLAYGQRRNFYLKVQPAKTLLGTEVSATILAPLIPLHLLNRMAVKGLPSSVSEITSLGVSVSDPNALFYKYKLFGESNGDCSDFVNYSDDQSLTTILTKDINSFNNGTYITLCLISHDNLHFISAWKHTWLKGIIASISFLNPSRIFQELTSQASIFSISSPQTKPLVLKYQVGGTSNTSDHSLIDGLITIPAGQTTISNSFNVLRNLAINDDKTLNISILSTDNKLVVPVNYNQSFNVIEDKDGGSQKIRYSKVSLGFANICSIGVNGRVYCWGSNGSGQLGYGTVEGSSQPKLINDLSSYVKISLGTNHSCGITDIGELKCWGSDANGQLGIGGGQVNKTSPTVIDTPTTYSQISLGAYHTCGITTSGVLKCWGENYFGKLGDNSNTDRFFPVVIDSGTSYSQISLGDHHTCGITTAGVLKCWGDNSSGQLGEGSNVNKNSPVVIDSPTTYSQVSLGAAYSCGITTGGVLKCWGNNYYGQLGDNTNSNRFFPKVIDSGTNYTQINLGNSHTCGITSGGELKCWGSNSSGQLGDGSYAEKFTPKVIDVGTNYVQIGLGSKMIIASNYTCGLTSEGVLKCWGINLNVPNTHLTLEHPTPLVIDNSTKYDAVTTSTTHTCGITNNKQIKCWGSTYNKNDALGIGFSGTSVPLPNLINDNDLYSKVITTDDQTCGINMDGTLKCWGTNTESIFGFSFLNYPSFATPVVVDTANIYRDFSLTYSSTGRICGITSSNSLNCWGNNSYGNLGDGTTITQSSPERIDSPTQYQQVSVGYSHTCGLTIGGLVKCWGSNDYGQLGDGSVINSYTPVPIDTLTAYKKISAGDQYTCGITVSGVLKCWGRNLLGQLGIGSTINRNLPQVVDVSTRYLEVSTGTHHTCGITTGKTLKCWGNNLRDLVSWRVGELESWRAGEWVSG